MFSLQNEEDNCNYVIVCYSFFHNLYYKVMDIINNDSHIRWDYLSARNIEFVEKELYEKLIA